MDENDLIMLQFFGFLVGVAVLRVVMRAAEFELLVIRSGDQFHLRMAIASIVHGTSERPDPFPCSLILIFLGVLLPEMNVSLLGFVSGSFLQAARMHIFLHLGVDFMLNFGILQQGMRSGGPLLDKTIRVVTSVVVHQQTALRV
jgi:hypothetical protein